MAPHKTIKTYENRKHVGGPLKSSDVVNKLWTKHTIKKRGRRKKKLQLKDLPPRVASYVIDESAPRLTCYSTDESLHCQPNNTFDRLLKGNIFNPIKVAPCPVYSSSQSDTSEGKLKLIVDESVPRLTCYSTDESLHCQPNNTFNRLQKGKVFNPIKVAPCPVYGSSQSDTSKSKSTQSITWFSPVATRSKQKRLLSENSASQSPNAPLIKSSTFDKPITKSLSIENEQKPLNVSSLCYIKLPQNVNLHKSYEPIFSDTFREKQAVHSSTPCIAAPSKKIVADKLSPINKSAQRPKPVEPSVIVVSEDEDDVQVISDSRCQVSSDLYSPKVGSGSLKPTPGNGLYSSTPVRTRSKARALRSGGLARPSQVVVLKPGKAYRRSLTLFRKSLGVHDNDCLCDKGAFKRRATVGVRRRSLVVPLRESKADCSTLETYARCTLGYVSEEQEYEELDGSIRGLSLSAVECKALPIVTAKEIVLRKCGQTEVLPFDECYPSSALKNCQKIGEGVYGEVFLYRNSSGSTSVMKVIPIEGDLIVNGEKQKKYEEILSEIVIAQKLSDLRNGKSNATSSFAQVRNVRCVEGSYPARLLDLWDLYDETKGSENDSPQMFAPDQQYIVLELVNGGPDLESYVFANAAQAFSMFKQTACALAVAEKELKFEHRDLHWGNVLLSVVNKGETVSFRLDDRDIHVKTHGVVVTIIDFTLSRVEAEGVVIYNDLSVDDELFMGEGDYQFEIYKLMKKANRNEWQHFEPYSNVLWLHYILDKAVTSALHYKNVRSQLHKDYIKQLREFKENILLYESALHFVTENFI